MVIPWTTRNSQVSTAPMASGANTRIARTNPRIPRSQILSSVSRFIPLESPDVSLVVQRHKDPVAHIYQFDRAVLSPKQIAPAAGRGAVLRRDINVSAVD